jgi:hypothetical protein
MSTPRYTTIQAAKKAGIPRATLQYWIVTAKVKAPQLKRINGKRVRQWTAGQIEHLVELRSTLQADLDRKELEFLAWKKRLGHHR